MPISAVDSISLAFQHTKRQLAQPFRLGRWVKLAFVGLLAGELGSSSGFNFPTSFKDRITLLLGAFLKSIPQSWQPWLPSSWSRGWFFSSYSLTSAA